MDDLPEISPLDPASDTSEGQTSSPPRRTAIQLRRMLADRRLRLALTALIFVGVVGYLLAQAVPDARARVALLFAPPTATATTYVVIVTQATLVITATQTPVPPVVGLMPPPPSDCPASPPLDTITAQPNGFSQPVTLYGRAPVWVPEGYLPQGRMRMPIQGTPEPYPGTKMIWEVGPTQYPTVTARVTDVATGAPAWWEGSTTSMLTTLTFDAGGGLAPPAFASWHTGLVFTHAGCYKLDVTWSGGEWYTIFAVGGPSGS